MQSAISLLAMLPLPVLQWAGRSFGRLHWYLHSDWALTTRANLQWCYPHLTPRTHRRLARASLEASGMLLFEALLAWRAAPERIEAAVASATGFEVTDGPGCTLALIPHFGNWEILHAWVAQRLNLTVMYRPPRHAALHRLLLSMRRQQRSRMVPATAAGVRELVRAVRRDGAVGILPDQAPTEGGVWANFFGHPALTVGFPGRLRPARVLMAWAERRADGRFDLHFKLVQLPREPEAWAAACNREIEQIVARQPEQYQWEYRRFKRQPEGAFRYHL